MVELAAIRAPLFVPANRPDRFAKAAASGADAVILDLEDAVGNADKSAARELLSATFTDLPVIVRVNGTTTRWHGADMQAVLAQPFAAVMLPKVENEARLAPVIGALTEPLPVLALIESAEGLANARAIAALPGVTRLVFGSLDYCADLGCAHDRDILLPARVELVLASRLAGKAAPIDGVTAQLDDAALLRADAAHARDCGMTGKLCIHPAQVAQVRAAFAAGAVERDWARRVLGSGEGAVAVDGAMVDEPVRQRARRILGLPAGG